ncbi:exocyst complex component 3-like protein isoform X2 [Phascolarctos cinereus]|uniref:Exocyst complex component 3-like protein n=1 Tax=Phascolarctos cinereus TaxID=38626 RepID=A0A6P5KJ58_PHACI|nr:exocyst complex component 3-like protein isoform X1 [Phascolarctos cinereus]
MGMDIEEEQESGAPQDLEWPELEKAERLARGAALKWASGIFYSPKQLTRLDQYRSREAQRMCSIESRIKSTVQSYLESVQTGLEQLGLALKEVQEAREALAEAQRALRSQAEAAHTLEPLQELANQHGQLKAVTLLLPQLLAVPEAVARTQALIKDNRFLEAYDVLRELEHLRDEVLDPFGGPELSLFEGLTPLGEELGLAMGKVVGSARQLARDDPALLVAAVRVAEFEEKRDAQLQSLSPGRPRAWRQHCLGALRRALEEAYFEAPAPAPPGLAGHLAALREALPAELALAEALVAPCCPGDYRVVKLWAHTLHHGLRQHLQRLLDHEDLGTQDIFTLLHWALHTYPGPEMMGHPDLSPEADISELEPLLSPEAVEQLERTYTEKLKIKVAGWLQNALDGEVAEWFQEQEPDIDPEGFYHSSLPAVVLQILDENIRVTAVISSSLQERIHVMALRELGTFLRSLMEALDRFSQEHLKDASRPCHYVPYLLACLNHYAALSSSVSLLQPAGVPTTTSVSAAIDAALGDFKKKICRLILDALLEELQPLFVALPSRQWLSSLVMLDNVCEKTASFCSRFSRVRSTMAQMLLAETERAVVLEYLRSLMQGKLVCRNSTERIQASERMLQDSAQLRELFLSLELEESAQTGAVLGALQELFRLQDPALLSLEVSSFLHKFPDVSEEHIGVLLDVRGDVSREQRQVVLETMQANPPPSPPPDGHRPLFSLVPVPSPPLAFCFPAGSCS